MGFYASLPLLAGTVADFAGGWISDRLLLLSGDVKRARKLVAVGGFLLASAGILPATLTHDPKACVAFSCLAVFGLELTVGVSWAVPLDIGGDYAGSVSAVMNMCGNIGGAISSQVLGYLVVRWGWNTPFLVASATCAVAALLFAKIDASKRIFD
jgi:MFS family permease